MLLSVCCITCVKRGICIVSQKLAARLSPVQLPAVHGGWPGLAGRCAVVALTCITLSNTHSAFRQLHTVLFVDHPFDSLVQFDFVCLLSPDKFLPY